MALYIYYYIRYNNYNNCSSRHVSRTAVIRSIVEYSEVRDNEYRRNKNLYSLLRERFARQQYVCSRSLYRLVRLPESWDRYVGHEKETKGRHNNYHCYCVRPSRREKANEKRALTCSWRYRRGWAPNLGRWWRLWTPGSAGTRWPWRRPTATKIRPMWPADETTGKNQVRPRPRGRRLFSPQTQRNRILYLTCILTEWLLTVFGSRVFAVDALSALSCVVKMDSDTVLYICAGWDVQWIRSPRQRPRGWGRTYQFIRVQE